MTAWLAKSLEWLHVQISFRRMPHPNGQNVRLQETLQFLNGPDFIPAESLPAPVQFDDAIHFRFPTPQPGHFAENNVVPGRLYRCSQNWRQRPTVILLHGRADFFSHNFQFPTIARRCNRRGFNAATLVAPFHFDRRPPGFEGWSNSDFLEVARAVGQAVSEIRALVGWLLAEGCPAVALWGISMGGSLTGLVVSHDPRPAAAVMIVPGVNVNGSITNRIIWRSVRAAMQRQRPALEALNTTRLNLASVLPAIDQHNLLFIEAIYDSWAPREDLERLWLAWGQPEIWRLPHGHSTWMTPLGLPWRHTPSVAERILLWLEPRLSQSLIGPGDAP